jgi:RNA polymerase sigma-70 factor (ECF subfamily)
VNRTYNFSSSGSPAPAVSERKLIRFSQQGDRDAFARLYDTYLARIHRYIFFRVVDHELAEDITSLVFLRGWEKLRTYQPGKSPFAAWLYRIAHNAVIDHYRTRKAVISLEELGPVELSYADEVDEKIEMNVLSQKLLEAMKQLTDVQKEVLILRFSYGCSTLEIARRLDKQEGAIRALQMRALKKLSDILSSKESEDGRSGSSSAQSVLGVKQ